MLIAPWLIHTVTRARRTGVSSKGEPTYGAQDTVRARVEFIQRLARSAEGKEIISNCEMALLDRPLYDDVFWLPSIAGSVADDTSSQSAGRTPVQIKGATSKLGTQQLWIVSFG